VLYFIRHSYGRRDQVICDLPPKVLASAMGDSTQTHLAAYCRTCGDDVLDKAFTKVGLRILIV
jgi:hypothetical protein